MGFEAATEFSVKSDSLQELVDLGILTKHDFELCIRALKKKETEKGLIYRDKFIAVEYRGYDEQDNYNGKSIRVKFVVQNRTAEPLTVKARVYVNGVIVSKEEDISRRTPEKSKVIEEAIVNYDTLDVIDVKTVEDIEDISFLFWTVDSKYRELNKAKKPVSVVLKI